MNLKDRARKLKTDIPTIFYSLKDKDTPLTAKIAAGITIGYALSPIDLVPDFIPVLGYLDDLILLPAFIALTIKLIPKDIWEKNKKQVQNSNDFETAKKWYYALPIILIWILIILLLIKIIWR
ncbi:YkvA family protein [Diplocloster hominis]|uniref:YkvA family protein n=1 Tax=Diplocloster hominis TaxID=3079010 RepID=UPI0031BA2429